MRLLNYQIDAIASKLSTDNQNKISAELKKAVEGINKIALEKQAKEAEKHIRTFTSKFPALVNEVFDYSFKRNKCDVGETLYQQLISSETEKLGKKLKTKKLSYDECRKIVVLKSIDCSNTSDLEKALGIKIND